MGLLRPGERREQFILLSSPRPVRDEESESNRVHGGMG